jgi:hypothetical protein
MKDQSSVSALRLVLVSIHNIYKCLVAHRKSLVAVPDPISAGAAVLCADWLALLLLCWPSGKLLVGLELRFVRFQQD